MKRAVTPSSLSAVSWRDTASAEAQQDLDALLNMALGFAQLQLAERGGFFPYAAAIRTDGEPEMIAAQPSQGEGEHPEPADILASCFAALTDKRGHIRAAAVISDVRTAEATEAIRIDLEHAEGLALAVLLPYARQKDGKLHYGEIRAGKAQRQIWG